MWKVDFGDHMGSGSRSLPPRFMYFTSLPQMHTRRMVYAVTPMFSRGSASCPLSGATGFGTLPSRFSVGAWISCT